MVSELQTKPEALLVKHEPETSRLAVSNHEMYAFQARTLGTPQDREQELFSNGFSFNQAKDIYDEKPTKLAQDVPNLPTVVPSPEQIGITKETTMAAVEIAQHILSHWTSEHPIAGQESALMQATIADNAHAWGDAKSAFPQLQNVSESLMKAYVRNELAYYDGNDWMDDLAAKSGHLRDQTATLGMSQISPKGVREFEKRYPQLKSFLADKGYGPGQEAQALLDPSCVAMIVAAKTASIVDDMDKHGIKEPTNAQLAYAFNPDVYSYSEDGSRKYKTMYQAEVKLSNAVHWDQKKEYYANKPEVIDNSEQVKHVLSWLK